MFARTLKSKVFISVSLMVLISGALVAAFTAQHYWSGLREAMRAEAASTAQRVANQAADKVLINDLVGIQRLLESYQASDPRLGYLLLVRDGDVLGHTFNKGVPVALLEDLQHKAPKEPLLTELVTTKGERYLDAVWPIMEGKAGVLRLGLNEQIFLAKLYELLTDIALITLAVLGLALGLCLLFVRQIARPLDTLVEATERVTDGDRHSRVEVKPGLGEVESLTNSFNRMVDRLAEKDQELERRHQELERTHRQTRTSCEIIKEIGAQNDASQIGAFLLGRLKEVLRCGEPVIAAALNNSNALLFKRQGSMETLLDADANADVLRMLETSRDTGYIKKEELPAVLRERIAPETGQVGWVPIKMEGRVPAALIMSCRPDAPCERCEIGFAEMVVGQASGSLMRALRQIEESKSLTEQVEKEKGFCEMVGKDPEMRAVYKLIRDVAPTDSTVLILGDSGTGKELAARAIHLNSSRKNAPFVVIDCSAYPPTLLESELFGHEKGAFTGATRTKPGRFEQAHGGTVFLDEIGEVPLSAQTKLLRVLQTHRFERLGGEKTLEMDVRILAATNKNLLEEVGKGRFREDLFYRLNVFPLRLPPLKQRINDVPLLARHFLERFAAEQGKSLEDFSPAAMRLLLEHPWPGNVRELENAVERASILAKERLVEPWDLPESIQDRQEASALSLDKHERQVIAETLEGCGWNKKLAANQLGISRTTLYRKIRKYQLDEPTRH